MASSNNAGKTRALSPRKSTIGVFAGMTLPSLSVPPDISLCEAGSRVVDPPQRHGRSDEISVNGWSGSERLASCQAGAREAPCENLSLWTIHVQAACASLKGGPAATMKGAGHFLRWLVPSQAKQRCGHSRRFQHDWLAGS